jgi:multidrug resistance efflux pump
LTINNGIHTLGETTVKKQLSFVFYVIMAIAILALSACSPKTTETPAVVQAAQPQGVIAEGRLMPANSLDQAFTIPGQVSAVLVKEGDPVTAGQELARLVDSPVAQAALARAQEETLSARLALDELQESAQLNLAQARLAYLDAQEAAEQAEARFEGNDSDQNKALFEQAAALLAQAEDQLAVLEDGDGVDADRLAAAQARLATANAQLENAQAQIDAQTLKATLSGTVTDLAIQPGQQVAAGEPVLTLADYSAWLVQTDNLTEMEVVEIEVGQKAEILLDALPEETLMGEVTDIAARHEEKRGDITYTVTLRLDQSNPLIRWGMTAAVYFLP